MTGVNDPAEQVAAQPMRDWGPVDDVVFERTVIVSPHLDDAVLGCGQLMSAHAGATVITVFAGNPAKYPMPQRPWDVQSGFGPHDDVMAARRAEDSAALAVLGAKPVHLNFVEFSYNEGDVAVAARTIAPVLADAIASCRPTVVLAPFGLANPDHDVTHRAAMKARAALRHEGSVGEDTPWLLFEDHGYKHIPGMLAWRVSRLFRAGLWPTPVCPRIDPSTDRKLAALAGYPSQLLALEDDWRISAKLAAPAPEQCWRIDPPPSGWEALADS